MASEEVQSAAANRYGRIGKYDVLAHLASGGMCVVYRAVDPDLGREVALKVLPPELVAESILVERFRREARHVAKLRHEHIVSIYEFGEANGMLYLALEYVDGIDLDQHIEQHGRLDPAESCLLLTQTALALEHLHKYQMVHRDIKPANLLLMQKNSRPHVKLTDLGLARITSESQFRVTKTGFTLGTVDYMAPEQARDSGLADIRSDLYSLGCTWYHMLAGRPPFPDGGLTERLYKHLEAKPVDVRQFNPRVSQAMVNILEKLLAKKPGERYQTPTLLLVDLARLEESAPALTPATRPPRSASKSTVPLEQRATVPNLEGRSASSSVEMDSLAIFEHLGLGPEQRQAAAGQCERAKEVLKAGNIEYAIHLLLSSCKLDPANTSYRRTLRRAAKLIYKKHGRNYRFTSLPPQTGRTKLKAAKTTADHLKVLEDGERFLLENPGDIRTQLDMAEAAEILGLRDLSIWILEHALRKHKPDLGVCRALARAYEVRSDFRRAADVWDIIHRVDPTDGEASQKARDLAAKETISRGRYGEEIERRWAEDAD